MEPHEPPPSTNFRKAYLKAPDLTRAEHSAVGTMPAAAFQYCEAMRTASAFGWYIYPPKDIHLMFDGKEIFYYEEDQWFPVKSVNFEDDFRSYWNSSAPADLRNCDPPFLSELFVPGSIQIWSGYFVDTSADWSVLIRPPVNYDTRSLFTCYEGLVETDQFKPLPLFINLKLLATNVEIFIPKFKPLFQVQPILRRCYVEATKRFETVVGIDPDSPDFDWDGFRNTVRSVEHRDENRPGSYGAERRRRR